MDNSLCAFCKYGNEVLDVCGKLYSEKGDNGKYVTAHLKCMQYSSMLTQYKTEFFGGFQIDSVVDEIKRARQHRCVVCVKNKRKSKLNGASAGCSNKRCFKTYHYYCAKMDPAVVTKRLKVSNKESSMEHTMYCVFCSKEHEDKFRTKLCQNDAKSVVKVLSQKNQNSETDESLVSENGEEKSRKVDAQKTSTPTLKPVNNSIVLLSPIDTNSSPASSDGKNDDSSLSSSSAMGTEHRNSSDDESDEIELNGKHKNDTNTPEEDDSNNSKNVKARSRRTIKSTLKVLEMTDKRTVSKPLKTTKEVKKKKVPTATLR